uniref:Uncharacterized protein n=1 Tax=Tanacetum cinerariifolium TaxID=118510 RepID=A0A699S8J2_TANCI|nr:hypothetical protein [Tanacetum cinerariifolium]
MREFQAWSSSMKTRSDGGQDAEVLPRSDPAWPSSFLAVFSSRFTLSATSSPYSSPIFRISVSPSLVETRELNEESVVLCCGIGGSGRVVVTVVAVNTCS